MENKQTAVEWFIDEMMKNKIFRHLTLTKAHLADEIADKAKQMERKQIEDAYNQDLYSGLSGNRKYENGSDYFTKTFTNGKDS